jgi:DNA-binding CsgD family transcriptional regulator
MTDDQARGAELQWFLERDTTSAVCAPLNGRSSVARLAETPQQSVRRLVEQRDAAFSERFELAQLWFELCRGAWRFRDTFVTETRCFALLEQVPATALLPLKAPKLAILESVLLGQAPKAVAIDLHKAISSVATACHDCLRQMGLPCRLTQASVLLTMAVCAARRPQHAPALGRLSRLEVDAKGHWFVSVSRPDLSFPVPLSRAEAAVVRELVAGGSHAQISGLRATSRRTVANQLATAFRKFGVSGRGAVVHELIQHSLANQSSAGSAGP